MQRQQILGGLVLLALTAAGIGLAWAAPEKQAEDFAAYEALAASAPAAELEGEALSPNGRFQVRAVGKSDSYVSGVVAPERLEIVDTETGEVKWEDMGYVTQSVLWSPGNNLVALAYGGRTWTGVKVISTAYWTSWDVALPDGSPIPEYTFLPENWGTWLDPTTLLLTVGRGGDGEEQKTYRCFISTAERQISGSTQEQTAEILPGEYDFDHDGEPEAVELATVWAEEGEERAAAWYELNVKKADGTTLWTQEAALAHVGWISVFACQIDGEDYLLWYLPWMGQGCAGYSYRIFSLDGKGQEVPVREDSLEFDINFGDPFHGDFDPAAIAAFLEEVHGWLDESTLLITTEGGVFRTGGSGADFRDDADFWGDDCPYDETVSLEQNLRNYEAHMKGLMGIE